MTESLARQWIRRVWIDSDDSAIDELLAADGVVHGLHGEEWRGPAGFRKFRHELRKSLEDLQIEVLEELADGDRVAVRCEARLTYRATRKRLQLSGTCFLQLRGGQILAARHWDFLEQLESSEPAPSHGAELVGSEESGARRGLLPILALIAGLILAETSFFASRSFEAMFKDLGQELPRVTVLLLELATVGRSGWSVLIAVGLVAFSSLLYWHTRNRALGSAMMGLGALGGLCVTSYVYALFLPLIEIISNIK